MRQNLRFQVLILPNLPWKQLLGRFTHVEELGFDLVATGDHFVDWTNPPRPWFELWTLLSAVAQATTTIRIARPFLPYTALAICGIIPSLVSHRDNWGACL